MTTSVNTNQNNVVMSELKDYDSLYKVDFNFDTDVTNMSADVLSEYINRVLANHPYYIEVTNIVDIIVDKKTNKVTVIVSNKEVGDRLTEISNNPINLNEVIEEDINSSIYNYPLNNSVENDKELELINDMHEDKKYILEYENSDGKTKLYEYDFNGYDKAKALYYDKHVVLNGNKKRHFLKNSNNNPYYYDDYMNSEINYVNEQDIDPENPLNVKKKLYNRLPENNVSIENNNVLNNALQQHNNVVHNINNDLQNDYLELNGNNINNSHMNNANANNSIMNNANANNSIMNNANNSIINNANNNNLHMNNANTNVNNESKKYTNYIIIFFILICVLIIIFIIFNYIFRKKINVSNVSNVNKLN